MIIVKDLKKIYGNKTILNNVSFKIGKGELVVFLGENGGK